MKMYRLKPEAVPFFKDKVATAVQSFDSWEKYNIDMNALEEVQPAYVTYGHTLKNDDGTSSGSLCGWSADDGARFHFTLHFPSLQYQEYDRFSKGTPVRQMMIKIQQQLDYFCQQFQSNEED